MNIKKDLLDVNYYYDRLTMFLKESLGIKDRIKFLCDFLNMLDDKFNELSKRLDVNDKFEPGEGIYNFPEYKDTDEGAKNINKFLDIIGSLFNIKRENKVYTIKSNLAELTNETKVITLNNYEFLLYIKLRIAQLNFSGSRENLANLYGGEEGLNDISKLPLEVNFIYIQSDNVSGDARCRIFWDNYSDFMGEETDVNECNLLLMFMNGFFTIESMGINYNRILKKVNLISQWDFKFGWGIDLSSDLEDWKNLTQLSSLTGYLGNGVDLRTTGITDDDYIQWKNKDIEEDWKNLRQLSDLTGYSYNGLNLRTTGITGDDYIQWINLSFGLWG